MLRTNTLNLLKNLGINNKSLVNKTFNFKNLLYSSSLNKISNFAFSEKSTMELIKILRAETSKLFLIVNY